VSRRTLTLIVSGALLAGLVAAAALLPVPYVIFRPGPLTDVLGEGDDGPIISAQGVRTYPTDGTLKLTTVGVTPADAPVDLVSALQAWVDPNKAVVPRDAVYPDNQTSEQAQQENAAVFAGSQELARVAALRYLGYDVPVEPDQVQVAQVLPDGAAAGTLEPGDVILAVDGEPVTSPDDVVQRVSATPPGDDVAMRIERDGRARDVQVPTKASQTDPDKAAIGVIVSPSWQLPVDISVDVPGQIGGPSAGLIFTLGIVDRLTPGALVDGRAVAGTGEIAPDGTVGPISGIQQKIAGAREQGTELFLAPRGNCAAVRGAEPGDMVVVPVQTLDDAVAAVEAYTAGEVDDLAGCDAPAATP
jgi:PDZ domain-containing protein